MRGTPRVDYLLESTELLGRVKVVLFQAECARLPLTQKLAISRTLA